MLSVILGFSEIAICQTEKNQPIYTDLLEIQQAARHSADLTRQLLAFARKQTVSPKILDLNDTVESMLGMLRRLIGEDIELLWLPGKKLGLIKIDPSQIDQILANLCVNARDAISDTGKITIRTSDMIVDETLQARQADVQPGRYILLSVSDTGCGMNGETQMQLFEPFFTTKELGKGTGLGLASVYGIVKQNNGFIDFSSEPGEGSIFRIYLPQYGDGEESLRSNDPASPALRGSETILLVEDEPAILRVVKRMIEALGYKVLVANSAVEAIDLARAHAGELQLLVTDVIMPEMNGRDLADILKPICPALKNLFMSGYTADVIAHHGVLDEGTVFIHKPFTPQDLAVKIREALTETD
jgi:CheY-like chemotaxis protein